ncbi:MAG: hypothetical protein HOP10_03450 [Chitinophagaceae bacterium]|nr:hypothetical protein [Chitinophagaceae bacterium]
MKITQNHIVEGLALITSIICWNDIKKGKLRWLPFFFFFILCVELTGTYFKKVPYANAKLYNFSIPIEYLFYLFLFKLHGKKILKKFAVLAMLVLATATIFYFINQPLRDFHAKVLLTGQATVILCCCVYFFEKFGNVEDESLLRDHFFWITSGLLLFNLEDFVYFLLYDILKANNWDPGDKWFKLINNSLLLLLYLSYIIAILIYRNNKQRNATRP